MHKYNILIPVYNDKDSLLILLKEINEMSFNNNLRLNILIVDDGSDKNYEDGVFKDLTYLSINYIKLKRNVGHQEAIYIGMMYYRNQNIDKLIIMDGDGEDKPNDLLKLIKKSQDHEDKIIVAKRKKRSESILFKLLYKIYKISFYFLTGKIIDFGNFVLMSKNHINKLISMPEINNHLAASIIKSKLPIIKIPIDRGDRYLGKSKMNYESLILHGLKAISVFSNQVIVRIIIFSILLIFFLTIIVIFIFYIRFFTDFLIPGQATSALGLLMIFILVILTNSILISFLYSSINNNYYYEIEKNFESLIVVEKKSNK